MLDELTGTVSGRSDGRLRAVIDRFEGELHRDSEYSFQAVAYRHGELVLDIWGGPRVDGDSLLVPFSVTKNTIGFSVALLVERAELDLDARVAHYWPEFAERGKGEVTVRMLLSHQAGLPQAEPSLAWEDLLDHHLAAEKLARTLPFWQPGSAFGYHAITIGNLASELVFRVTGRTLHEFYESEIRAPHDLDFYLGLPSELEGRRVPIDPIVPPEGQTAPPELPPMLARTFSMDGPPVDLANDERSWRFGHPAGSGTGSARGIARLLAAAVTGVDGRGAFLSPETVGIVGQQQVHGFDEVLSQPDRAHSIIFQKPTASMPFGGPRAFGHDGAQGALAAVDPDTGIAFAYTVVRGPWPGGADPRAISLSRELREAFAS